MIPWNSPINLRGNLGGVDGSPSTNFIILGNKNDSMAEIPQEMFEPDNLYEVFFTLMQRGTRSTYRLLQTFYRPCK